MDQNINEVCLVDIYCNLGSIKPIDFLQEQVLNPLAHHITSHHITSSNTSILFVDIKRFAPFLDAACICQNLNT